MPKDDICYIITKKGPMIKKKLGMVESLVPVKDISILQDLQSYVKLNIPKIPEDLVANTYVFFKAIYNKHRSESIVLIFYNEETKNYIIEPPPQTGNSASLDYTKGTLSFEGYNLVGTIHSHASMSAFHSGTDHDDEANFDGLHITFGSLNSSDDFTLSCSVVSNGFRSIVEPEQYMEGIEKFVISPDKPTEYTVTRYRYDHEKKTTVPYQVKMKSTYKPKPKIRFKMTVPNEKLIFDKTWMNKFKYEAYKYKTTWGKGTKKYGYNMFLDDTDWTHWAGPTAKSGSPLNVGESKNVTPVKFDGNTIDPDANPCEKCVFLRYKLEWALNFVDWEEDDDDDILLDEEDDDDYLMADVDAETEFRESHPGLFDTVDDEFVDPDSDILVVSTEDADFLDRDDGSMMYDPDIHDMVKDQHNSDEFLHGKSHDIDDEPYDGKEIPTPDEVPQFSLTAWLKQRVANKRKNAN